ncbi:hypothetical protein N9A28_02585 [Sulfurimonas sp.]|nr:hypothetical protein [Sulfurimonas sp.]
MIVKPNSKYNQNQSHTKGNISKFKKVSNLLSLENINNESKSLINMISEKILDINFGNDKLSKKFNGLLNSIVKTDKSLVDFEISLLFKVFTLIVEKSSDFVNVHKSCFPMKNKKSIVIHYIQNLITSENDFNKNELQNFVNRLQNSNHMINYYYLNMTQRNMTNIELVKSMRNLLTDNQQVNSTSLFNLSGGKGQFIGSVQNVIHQYINLEKVNRLIIPFGGSGMDFMNVTPLIEPGTEVILNSINKTNSQLFKDIKENRQKLIEGVLGLEVEFTTYSRECSGKKVLLEVYQDFFEQKLKELNQLESYGFYGIGTSVLFIFLSNKTYGGNIEWTDGITYIPTGKCKSKYEKSVVSKIEYFGYWLDQFNVVVECEDYTTILDKYDNESSLTISDPLYVKENESELLQTRVTYGEDNFPHRQCIDYTMGLKGQFIYHNYNNSKLIELFSERSDIGFVQHKKSIQNTESVNGKKPKCVELIFFTKEVDSQSLNNNDYQPQLQLVS